MIQIPRREQICLFISFFITTQGCVHQFRHSHEVAFRQLSLRSAGEVQSLYGKPDKKRQMRSEQTFCANGIESEEWVYSTIQPDGKWINPSSLHIYFDGEKNVCGVLHSMTGPTRIW